MAIFIDNFKTYIDTMKYKQSFIATKSGIHVQTLSRLMTGKQEIKEEEMLKLARSVHREIGYFLSDNFVLEVSNEGVSPAACYMGNSVKDKEELILDLKELAESIDSILGKSFRLQLYEEV